MTTRAPFEAGGIFVHALFISCHARAHAQTQDPDSPQYGQYLTSAEVIRLTATDPATVTRVRGALAPASCFDRGDSLRYALFSRPVHGNRVACDWTCLLTVRPPPTPPHHPVRPSTFTP